MNKQEAIEKIKDLYNFVMEDGPFEVDLINKNQAIDIISQIDEPQKIMVPKFVAEWIGYCKSKGFKLLGALDPVSELGVGLVTSLTEELRKGKDWAQRNQETFTRAWLYGYEIEQEKLYTVEIPNPNLNAHVVLQKTRDGLVLVTVGNAGWAEWESSKLTEAEIKQDFEWAWQFAKEVE